MLACPDCPFRRRVCRTDTTKKWGKNNVPDSKPLRETSEKAKLRASVKKIRLFSFTACRMNF